MQILEARFNLQNVRLTGKTLTAHFNYGYKLQLNERGIKRKESGRRSFGRDDLAQRVEQRQEAIRRGCCVSEIVISAYSINPFTKTQYVGKRARSYSWGVDIRLRIIDIACVCTISDNVVAVQAVQVEISKNSREKDW